MFSINQPPDLDSGLANLLHRDPFNGHPTSNPPHTNLHDSTTATLAPDLSTHLSNKIALHNRSRSTNHTALQRSRHILHTESPNRTPYSILPENHLQLPQIPSITSNYDQFSPPKHANNNSFDNSHDPRYFPVFHTTIPSNRPTGSLSQSSMVSYLFQQNLITERDYRFQIELHRQEQADLAHRREMERLQAEQMKLDQQNRSNVQLEPHEPVSALTKPNHLMTVSAPSWPHSIHNDSCDYNDDTISIFSLHLPDTSLSSSEGGKDRNNELDGLPPRQLHPTQRSEEQMMSQQNKPNSDPTALPRASSTVYRPTLPTNLQVDLNSAQTKRKGFRMFDAPISSTPTHASSSQRNSTPLASPSTMHTPSNSQRPSANSSVNLATCANSMYMTKKAVAVAATTTTTNLDKNSKQPPSTMSLTNHIITPSQHRAQAQPRQNQTSATTPSTRQQDEKSISSRIYVPSTPTRKMPSTATSTIQSTPPATPWRTPSTPSRTQTRTQIQSQVSAPSTNPSSRASQNSTASTINPSTTTPRKTAVSTPRAPIQSTKTVQPAIQTTKTSASTSTNVNVKMSNPINTSMVSPHQTKTVSQIESRSQTNRNQPATPSTPTKSSQFSLSASSSSQSRQVKSTTTTTTTTTSIIPSTPRQNARSAAHSTPKATATTLSSTIKSRLAVDRPPSLTTPRIHQTPTTTKAPVLQPHATSTTQRSAISAKNATLGNSTQPQHISSTTGTTPSEKSIANHSNDEDTHDFSFESLRSPVITRDSMDLVKKKHFRSDRIETVETKHSGHLNQTHTSKHSENNSEMNQSVDLSVRNLFDLADSDDDNTSARKARKHNPADSFPTGSDPKTPTGPLKQTHSARFSPVRIHQHQDPHHTSQQRKNSEHIDIDGNLCTANKKQRRSHEKQFPQEHLNHNVSISSFHLSFADSMAESVVSSGNITSNLTKHQHDQDTFDDHLLNSTPPRRQCVEERLARGHDNLVAQTPPLQLPSISHPIRNRPVSVKRPKAVQRGTNLGSPHRNAQ